MSNEDSLTYTDILKVTYVLKCAADVSTGLEGLVHSKKPSLTPVQF